MAYPNFTVVEAQNIAMGQVGVAFRDNDNTYTPPTGLVVVAITFVTDTAFDNGTTVESTNFTSQADKGPEKEGESAANEFGSTVFPAGLTMYGRFTAIDLAADGSAILYLAP